MRRSSKRRLAGNAKAEPTAYVVFDDDWEDGPVKRHRLRWENVKTDKL